MRKSITLADVFQSPRFAHSSRTDKMESLLSGFEEEQESINFPTTFSEYIAELE